jgi:hypothetical protein
MFSARILIVSGREEVVAELQPLIRAGQHLASVVPDSREFLDLLDAGMVPDIVISDSGSLPAREQEESIGRFHELNRVGCHLVVADAASAGAAAGGPFSELRRPFVDAEVRALLEDSIRRIERELRSTRSEVWRSLDRLRREVEELRCDMIRALARTIAARDSYMTGHTDRVSELCMAMAERMGLGEDERRRLATAAQLHEIGKVSVPVELLQKESGLTPDELERIRSHARTGAGILREVPSLSPFAPLVEHLGTAFRDLPGDLPRGALDARLIGILRVADVWDAVTSARAYRAAMPRSYWEPFLRGGAGTDFDAAAVEALFAVLGAGAPGR